MNENKTWKLTVASSPHVSSPASMGTRSLMLDVLFALVPALCVGVYFFGPRALLLTAVSVAGCEFFEILYRKLLKKPGTAGDLSAAVTGVLVAFVCPVAIPYWAILVGDFFAIIVVKQLFGGLGKNFLNPALAGRAFLMLSIGQRMTTWIRPGINHWLGITESFGNITDAMTTATPLGGGAADPMDMFLGNVGGCIGEVSAAALILGGVYLIVRGVIQPRIPGAYIGTVALLALLFPMGHPPVEWMSVQIMGGGLLLGAFFMATDYVTSPCTPVGEIIYGVGCGLLTVFIRYFGGYPEGVSYAILLMNICVPIIEKHTHPKRFGGAKEGARTAKKGGSAA